MTPELLAEIHRTLEYGPLGFMPYTVSEETKRANIINYGQRYGCDILVETGTHKGDTVAAVKDRFRETYSIEVGPQYYHGAAKRFEQDSNVHIILGDAGEVLPALLPTLDAHRIIFYLDAHGHAHGLYDGATPNGKGIGTSVPAEIEAISRLRPDSVVLIDDARLFTHLCDGWPELMDTIQEIEALNIWNIELKTDMIRLVPQCLS